MAEHREALLKKKHYYESCPGCKIDLLKNTQVGAPYKLLFYIFLVVICSALPISSLFPFLYFMIRDFHIAKREEDIAYYAGYVGSAFMFGRALTSYLWGVIADRYGRKPVLIFGAIIVIIFNALFGLSISFWMAISTRFLLGSLCGILGPVRAYACEVCRKEHQALGMSVVSISWGIGLVIGPAIGGFLAQPAEKYPNIFSKDSIFGRFPYFLPCLVISVFSLGSLVISFLLPETLHRHEGNEREYNDSCDELESADKDDKVESAERECSTSAQGLFKNWPLMSSITVFCVFQLADMAYSEIFPLWAVSPRKNGGLSYSTVDVGNVLSISGLGLLLCQLVFYPPVEREFGPVMISRIGAVLTIPLLSSYPYIAKLTGLVLTLLVNSASLLKNVLSVSIITGLLILQNRSVTQQQRGAANGLSMTAMSLFKAVGPAAGGSVFSWAVKRQDASFLPGTKMVFFALNLVEVIGLLLTFKPFLRTPNDNVS